MAVAGGRHGVLGYYVAGRVDVVEAIPLDGPVDGHVVLADAGVRADFGAWVAEGRVSATVERFRKPSVPSAIGRLGGRTVLWARHVDVVIIV